MFTHCPSVIKFSFHLDKCRYQKCVCAKVWDGGEGGLKISQIVLFMRSLGRPETGPNTLDKRERERREVDVGK